MEYTQWGKNHFKESRKKLRLNPCCNGIYSMRVNESVKVENKTVLILVVMEYTQWEQRLTYPLYKAF